MPPHLHPRSASTLSLFTSTLAISFLVVGAPHLLPCPVPHTAMADGESMDGVPQRRRRRRKVVDSSTEQDGSGPKYEAVRECPVPKPGGLVAQILGFEKSKDGRLPVVKVERFRDRRRAAEESGGDRS